MRHFETSSRLFERGDGSTTRLRLAAGVAIVGLLGGRAARAQQSFTVEQALRAPFGSELVAAPTQGALAWMENILGTRNIWIAEAPGYHGRQLTHFSGDNGRYLVQLAFTPDARAIVFTYGGSHSGRNLLDPPNPTMNPAGADQEVWIATIPDGRARRIDTGFWPAVSPRGDWVAYIKDDQIWGAPLRKTANGWTAGTPRQLVHDRGREAPQGNSASLFWSPKGDRLAFISLRDQHSLIGVWTPGVDSLVFMDPSTDHDQWLTWSPDGTRLAFVRIASIAANGQRGGGSGAGGGSVRSAVIPWSIRVADATTGEGREVWRADPGTGSAFWLGFMNNPRQLFWTADDQIVFPWERTGWMHMYAVPVAGGAVRELTPGDGPNGGQFEVEDVALSPDGREIVYSSNQNDIDRRHLWRVSPSGGAPQPVTSGSGIEYWPVFSSDGGVLAFQTTTAKTPPDVELIRASELRAAEPNGVPAAKRVALAPGIAPEGFPGAAFVVPRQVIFKSLDGLPVHGQLYLPPRYDSTQRHPAVVYLHGGPNSEMVLGYHYHRFDYYQKPYALIQYLASEGYLVLSVNYRRGTGYGLDFREPLPPKTEDPRFDPDVIDIIGGGEYLKGRTDVDSTRIGIWGGSAGGQRTILGLIYAPELFAAGVDQHGVATQSLGKTASWKAPVLIIHGDDDRNVPFWESVQLAAELRSHGVHVEELIFPNEIHSFLRHRTWVRAYETAAAFLDRELKNRTAVEAQKGSY